MKPNRSALLERLMGKTPPPAQAAHIAANAWWADRALLVLTLGWIVYSAAWFPAVAGRPEALFAPANWMGRLLMPFPMPLWLTLGVAALAAGLTVWLLLKPNRRPLRLLLLGLLLWLNLVRWSYGYLPHTAHIFLLAHFFFAFHPVRKYWPPEAAADAYRGWQWLALGVLATYTFAGFWKVVALAAKLLGDATGITWLNPEAVYVNAVSSWRGLDIPLDRLPGWLSPAPYWPIAFSLILILQCGAVLGALRMRLLPWTGLALVVFHLLNTYLFFIEFWVAPLTLLVLFFPYHRFLNRKMEEPEKVEGDRGLSVANRE